MWLTDSHVTTASRGKNWTLTPKLIVILVRCSFAVLVPNDLVWWHAHYLYFSQQKYMGLSQSSKNLRELCNTRVLAGTTHFYGNAVSTRSRTTTPLLTPQNCPFPLTCCVALTTVCALPCDTVIKCIDWEFVTFLFKVVKIREFYEIFKIRINSYKFVLSHHW